MAVDFFVNVLNTPHFPIFRAGNDCPAVVFSGGASGAAAGGEVGTVPLVDVRAGVGVLLPVAQQLLRKIRGDVQIQRQIGADLFPLYLNVCRADILAQTKETQEPKLQNLSEIESIYEQILEKQQCFTLKQLAVTGCGG